MAEKAKDAEEAKEPQHYAIPVASNRAISSEPHRGDMSVASSQAKSHKPHRGDRSAIKFCSSFLPCMDKPGVIPARTYCRIIANEYLLAPELRAGIWVWGE